MRNNQALPNAHFRKTAKRIITKWNVAAKKQKRRSIRNKKSKMSCRPLKRLYPVIQSPTLNHNFHKRFGKGFTEGELKNAGLNIKEAKQIGIAVDVRRRDQNMETMQENIKRLKEYQSKLVFYKDMKEAKSKNAICFKK